MDPTIRKYLVRSWKTFSKAWADAFFWDRSDEQEAGLAGYTARLRSLYRIARAHRQHALYVNALAAQLNYDFTEIEPDLLWEYHPVNLTALIDERKLLKLVQ